MAGHAIPHFHNEAGAPVIEVGVREFMCIGAKPPFDHPHVYIDMGAETEAVCPYCSTLFRYNKELHGEASLPPAAWHDAA